MKTLLTLANEAAAAIDRIGLVFHLSNEAVAEGAEKPVPEWIEVPLGNHDHKQGVQIVDRASADAMLANFQQEAKARAFKGLPIYVGHPDVKEFANQYRDKSAKGWIKDMQVSDTALRLKVDWNKSGRALIANEEYAYFSPTWLVQPVTGKAAAYRPVRLKSVGLTNEPNIGVNPLTNEADPRKDDPEKQTPEDDKDMPPWIKETLGLAADATDEEVKSAIADAVTKAGKAKDYADAHAKLKEKQDDADKAHQKLSKAYADLDEKHKAITQQMANERTARATLIVANCVTAGRILPADKDKTITELCNAGEGFDAAAGAIEKKAPVLRTAGASAHTAHLGNREARAESPSGRFVTLVNERMTKTSEDWDTAWTNTRTTHPEIYLEMKQPATAK